MFRCPTCYLPVRNETMRVVRVLRPCGYSVTGMAIAAQSRWRVWLDRLTGMTF